MLIKKPPPHGSWGRTRCEAACAEAEPQHAPTSMSAPRSGRKKGRRAGCPGMLQYFCSIINGVRAHRPGRSRGGAHGGGRGGGTRHGSGKAFGFPTPPSPPVAPKSSWPLPRVQGNGATWALGQAAQRMEQSSESTQKRSPPPPTSCHPGGRAPTTKRSWCFGGRRKKNSGVCFWVKTFSMGSLRASFHRSLPNGSPSTEIKVGGKQQHSVPPK